MREIVGIGVFILLFGFIINTDIGKNGMSELDKDLKIKSASNHRPCEWYDPPMCKALENVH